MVSSPQISRRILYAVFISLPPPWPICMLSPSNHSGDHLFLADWPLIQYTYSQLSAISGGSILHPWHDTAVQCTGTKYIVFFLFFILKEMRKVTYLYSWVVWVKSLQWWMLQNVTHSRLKAGLYSLSTAPCHWQIKIRWDPERLSVLYDLQGSTAPLLCSSVTSTKSIFMNLFVNMLSYHLLLIYLQMLDSKCEQ